MIQTRVTIDIYYNISFRLITKESGGNQKVLLSPDLLRMCRDCGTFNLFVAWASSVS